MKRIVFFIGVALAFSSCTSTLSVVRFDDYQKANREVAAALNAEGYFMSSKTNDTYNEVVATGDDELKNNYYSYETYTFIDSAQNTISYTVKYQTSKDNKGSMYLKNMNVTECATSDVRIFDHVCSDNGLINTTLNAIKKSEVVIHDSTKTVLACFGIVIALPTLIALTCLT